MSTSRGREDRERRVGERRLARERALSVRYEADAKHMSSSELLAELAPPPSPYCKALLVGLEQREDEVDELIGGHTNGWAFARLAVIDRELLRLSTYEILEGSVPLAVVIDEAVELAKQYSTEESASFVNGVLSAIAADLDAKLAPT